jgi:TPR repeat protein
MIETLRTGVETNARRYTGVFEGGWEAIMGRAELAAIESGSTGEASGDMFFRLGMMYSTGADMPTDYVTAHKWFNLAAARGNADAARLRREIAAQMSQTEIAAAQRAARAWLRH